MDLGLAGRVGIVTGGEGEIRAATERLLREEGAEVRELAGDAGAGNAGAGDGDDAPDGDAPAEVDFLVNFTGDAPAEDLRAAFEETIIAPLRAMTAIAPELAERGRGRIVNVVPSTEPVTSAAALALSRLFSDRYAKQGVLVNAVSPAPDADPEAIAREIAFLCSARASHIAGATWSVPAGVID
jgi:3-oxoacyl-[acyl-carrier protein] reductase